VQNVANHLFAAEQTVRHELAGTNSCSRHLKGEQKPLLPLITEIVPQKLNKNQPTRESKISFNEKIYQFALSWASFV
jgi:hypothetical protein